MDSRNEFIATMWTYTTLYDICAYVLVTKTIPTVHACNNDIVLETHADSDGSYIFLATLLTYTALYDDACTYDTLQSVSICMCSQYNAGWIVNCNYRIVPGKHPWALAARSPKIGA